MRDSILRDALEQLATEAATHFSGVVARGEEIPFDVARESGEGTQFFSYVPRTARFVVDRADDVRALPSFGTACAAVASADVAASYLESRGLPVPADPARRAAGMLVAFIAEIWDGCAGFSLDSARLDLALAALEAETRDLGESDLLIAPIVGLRMPVANLELASGVRLVRSDTIEAPLEAMSSEGMQRNAWEPQFLAVAEQGEGSDGSAAAMGQLRDLISVMRLFKEGGIGLGPFAFSPTGEGEWRRPGTGAPATRPGGYRLTASEPTELAEFAARLEARPDPDGLLSWAVGRFELGCERATALDGLSDHLLALRALLEGEGPVGASLPLRASALIASGPDRVAARAAIEEAFELEQRLMVGADLEDTGRALGRAVWIEERVRVMLRDAALGNLGRDLGTTADESLVASAVAAGDGSGEQRGETAEWEAIVEDELGDLEVSASRPRAERQGETDADPDGTTRILEPIPGAEEEIRLTARQEIRGGEADREEADGQGERAAEAQSASEEGDADWGFEDDEEEDMSGRDWLSEVSREERATLEWPAAEAQERGERERIDTPRVRHLFPVPDDAEWEVAELDYDRRAGAGR